MKYRSFSLFRNIGRLLKYRLIIPLLRSEKPAQYKAKGVAVGLAWALTPLIGVQMWLVFITWLIWKKLSSESFSLTLALAWTWVTNVFTMVPVYYVFYVTGQLLQGNFEDIGGYDKLHSIIANTFLAEYDFFEKWGVFFKLLVKDWGVSMVIGCLPWIVIGYAGGYYFTMAFEQARIKRKMQNISNGFINLSNELAECKISLWGGNIVSYRPKNEEHDVFWMGDLNKFDNIQAIRGGIPVCWPRFAEEKLNDSFPRHGFARLSNWKLEKVNIKKRKIEVALSLLPDSKYNAEISANLLIKITDKLECRLETINHSDKDFKFSEALHAYFNVRNRDNVTIKGLKDHQYRSSLDGKLYTLKNDLQINGEFDAAFINHSGRAELIDPEFKRAIILNKEGSKSTVVWNPNKDLAEMSEGQYKNFICVEPANQGDLFVTLPPKEKHIMSMSVEVHKL